MTQKTVYVISEVHNSRQAFITGNGSVKRCLQYRLIEPLKNSFGIIVVQTIYQYSTDSQSSTYGKSSVGFTYEYISHGKCVFPCSSALAYCFSYV